MGQLQWIFQYNSQAMVVPQAHQGGGQCPHGQHTATVVVEPHEKNHNLFAGFCHKIRSKILRKSPRISDFRRLFSLGLTL
jgi:hypothetical protein